MDEPSFRCVEIPKLVLSIVLSAYDYPELRTEAERRGIQLLNVELEKIGYDPEEMPPHIIEWREGMSGRIMLTVRPAWEWGVVPND